MIKSLFIFLFSALPIVLEAQQPTDTLAVDSLSLKTMIGQMIFTGIGNISYLPDDADILLEIKKGIVGGLILFEKNINEQSPGKQLRRTIKLLQSNSEIPLFIAIDEEGGKVNRLKSKYGFPETVEAAYLGKLDNLDSTFEYAFQTAQLLDSLGFNVNFAPVVDVAINPDNPVIAMVGRSFSADPKEVTLHAKMVIEAHRKNGVLTVLKHFPGHGSSHSDTHLGIADVTDYWQFSELLPYKILLDSGLVDAIMTAHIVNAHLDPDQFPATLSPIIINNILRSFLNYDGVVFSDDMQMQAISEQYGFEQSIKMAIDAGVDVLMFANNVPDNKLRTATQIHQIIMDLVNSGVITRERINVSYKRIMKLKTKLKSNKEIEQE